MTITLLPYVLVLRSFLNPFLIRVNHLNQLNHSSRHFLNLKILGGEVSPYAQARSKTPVLVYPLRVDVE